MIVQSLTRSATSTVRTPKFYLLENAMITLPWLLPSVAWHHLVSAPLLPTHTSIISERFRPYQTMRDKAVS